jgi:LysM repeat protein
MLIFIITTRDKAYYKQPKGGMRIGALPYRYMRRKIMNKPPNRNNGSDKNYDYYDDSLPVNAVGRLLDKSRNNASPTINPNQEKQGGGFVKGFRESNPHEEAAIRRSRADEQRARRANEHPEDVKSWGEELGATIPLKSKGGIDPRRRDVDSDVHVIPAGGRSTVERLVTRASAPEQPTARGLHTRDPNSSLGRVQQEGYDDDRPRKISVDPRERQERRRMLNGEEDQAAPLRDRVDKADRPPDRGSKEVHSDTIHPQRGRPPAPTGSKTGVGGTSGAKVIVPRDRSQGNANRGGDRSGQSQFATKQSEQFSDPFNMQKPRGLSPFKLIAFGETFVVLLLVAGLVWQITSLVRQRDEALGAYVAAGNYLELREAYEASLEANARLQSLIDSYRYRIEGLDGGDTYGNDPYTEAPPNHGLGSDTILDPPPDVVTHIVATNENLGGIALRHYGSSAQVFVNLIMEANSLTSTNIQVGQPLVIPPRPAELTN